MFSILGFGYAPAIHWEDEQGVASGWISVGTFPRQAEELELLAWAPELNLMGGVGYFPPKLEEMINDFR